MTNSRPETQIMLRITKTDPEPKVREAKWAAHHQNRRNNPSADGLPSASGCANCSMVERAIKNRGARQ